MNKRNLILAALSGAAFAALWGCATVAPATTEPTVKKTVKTVKADEPQLVSIQQMNAMRMGRLEIRGWAPGWVQARIVLSVGAKPFKADLPAGLVLRGAKTTKLSYLTLAGAAVPASPVGQAPVLIPVTALFAGVADQGALGKAPAATATASGETYTVEAAAKRAELLEIAAHVSSPQRKWRPSRGPAIIAPQEYRHLKRAVFAGNAAEWARAADFFAERTPIQIAVWMLLYNVNAAELRRELVAYGPDMEPLKGAEFDAALSKVVADVFALWVDLGYKPGSSRLGANFPELAQAAVANRHAAKIGQDFPGSGSPLTPLAEPAMQDPAFLVSEALLAKGDYGNN